jgi:tetratricopeptide (TPR) repeat protein
VYAGLGLVPCYLVARALGIHQPRLVFFFVASSVATFAAATALVARTCRPQTRRLLAVRRVSGLHLLLVVLLAPPLLVVAVEASNWAAHALGRPPGADTPDEPRAGRAATRLAKTNSFAELADQMYQEMARQPWLLILFAGCLLPGLGEEAFCRGFLGRGLLARHGPFLGILATSVFFGLLHVDPVRVCAATVLGVGLHVAFLAARSFWAPVLLHALNNALVFASIRLAQDANFDASGQYDAPHIAAPFVLAALAAVAALALLLYRTRTRWLLPDGREWSPGYLTAEMPPAGAAAVARRGRPGLPPLLGAAGAYFAFGLAAYLQADPGAPRGAWGYTSRGNEHLDKGEYDEALADYTEALRLDPGYACAYANRGIAHIRKGDYAQALPDLDRAIRLDPGLADAYLNRGFVRHQQGLYDRAIADYSQALRLNPEEVQGYTNRGSAYRQQGDYDRAAADFTAVIRRKPESAEAYAWRGEAYYQKGLYGRAVADFTRAIQREPENAAAYFDRGLAHTAQGDHARARADRERALRLDPTLAARVDEAPAEGQPRR